VFEKVITLPDDTELGVRRDAEHVIITTIDVAAGVSTSAVLSAEEAQEFAAYVSVAAAVARY
jgi:hypothetical protein